MIAPVDIQIDYLQKEERGKVALLLTNAFETNAAYGLIFTQKNKLREGLLWLFKTNLFLINRRKLVTKVVKEKCSGEIIGVFSLIPPGGVKVKPTDYLQIGLPQFLMKFGFGALRRMLGMDSYNKQLLTTAIGTNEYYYLSMVVVNEKYRGSGIGSHMIKTCLDELRSTERECHIWGLTTQLPENGSLAKVWGYA